ncbi:MAG: polyamine aminopropyltransferase [Deltaproteobacteria bacterium]|nr:polyamine aminopropyltransferase [Deltaproteobacteria bacterium]MBW1928401.1 polyamine aminopropyltransferase [Deltaproteobacteria bacterium]MBW2023800.1 polyamine aminopropyltransferase [Deltaproteobacteria bacterium]MBW2124328.1 polyamine aminopropyltransferase [Deltaproteobacteria bacterium]RLB20364.1 MAG: polyamine aminopropyltransferase [Deltaproteobacteria bacterium]
MNKTQKEIALVDFDPEKNQILELWFNDSVEFGHGCRVSIRIKNVLCFYRSEYQEIAIFETEKLGRMLVLDGITMLTEFDEFAYHEMIVHVPLLVHPNPTRILVIGGGDGGTVRELLKHPEVEQIHVCELDREVVKACRKYLPSLAFSFDDPKVQVFYEDGAKFVEENPETYDIIIVDSTDPIGPGQILFQRKFYEDMKKSLKSDGIVVTQCESLYLHKHVIGGVASFAREIYPKLGYYCSLVPTYPSGLIGFFFCSNKYDPIDDLSEERASKLPGLKYYTPRLHRASFVLPKFGEEILQTSS